MNGTSKNPRVAMTAFAAWVAVSADLGAVGLGTGLLPVDAAMAARLPLHSPVLGGIALAVIVGLPCTAVGWLAWRRDPRARDAAILAGLLLIGWIIAEVAIIREFSALQLVYAAAGVALVWTGDRQPRVATRAASSQRAPGPLYRRQRSR